VVPAFQLSWVLRLPTLKTKEIKWKEAPWLLLPYCIFCHPVKWCISIPDKTCIQELQSCARSGNGWFIPPTLIIIWFAWIPYTRHSDQRIHWGYINFCSNFAGGCRRHPILKYGGNTPYSILHYRAAMVWNKKLQSANLRNIEQRKHKITYKHHWRLGTMINSKRLRSKTNMSNLCWSTFKIGHQFQ
jgi:hypothetical protein